jgi:hypothetical protein
MAHSFNWFDGVKVWHEGWDSKRIYAGVRQAFAPVHKLSSIFSSNGMKVAFFANPGK